jgi:hypothetical protein
MRILYGLAIAFLACSTVSAQTTQPASDAKIIPLDDKPGDWKFGADTPKTSPQPTLVIIEQSSGVEGPVMKMTADFTAGGRAAEAKRDMGGIPALEKITFKVRSTNAKIITVRIIDATGQTIQRGRLPIRNDDWWNPITFSLSDVSKTEHWGGANDGKVHLPLRSFVISFTAMADPQKKPVIEVAEVRGHGK